jgi:hypothetical protein
MYDYTMKAAPEHAGEYHQYHSNFHILWCATQKTWLKNSNKIVQIEKHWKWES